MIQLYEYLNKNELLPRQKYEVQSGDTLESIVSSKGLLPAGFTGSFEQLFCKLNSSSCKTGYPTLTPGSVVFLPDLPLQAFVGKKYVDLDALHKATKRPVNLQDLSTLIGTIPDVRQKLEEYNPGLSNVPLDQQTTGKFNIPTVVVRTTAMIPSEARKRNDTLRTELKGKAQIFQVGGDVEQKETLSERNGRTDSQSLAPATGDHEPQVPPAYFAAIHEPSVAVLPTDVAIVDFPVNENRSSSCWPGVTVAFPKMCHPIATYRRPLQC